MKYFSTPEVQAQLASALIKVASALADPNRNRNKLLRRVMSEIIWDGFDGAGQVAALDFIEQRLRRFINWTPQVFAAQRKAAWWNMLAAAGIEPNQQIGLYLGFCPEQLTDGERAAIVHELMKRGHITQEDAENRLVGTPRRFSAGNNRRQQQQRCGFVA